MDVMSRKRGPEGLPRSGDEGKRPRLDCRMSDTEDSLGSDTDADESDEVSDPEGSRPPGLAVKGVVWASKSLEVRDLRVRCSGSESLALIGREALDIRGLLKRSDVEDRVEVVGSEEGAVHENPDNTSSGDPAWAFKSTEIRDLRVRCSGSESLALIGPEALDIRGLLKRSEDEDDRVENVEKRSQDGEDRLEYVGSEESAVQEKRDQLSSGDPPGVNESSPELSKSGSFESARSGDSSGLVEHGSPRGSDSRAAMFERFQRWVQETYSAQTKTKTITQLKYDRIVRTLHGLIPNVAGNSKFRFWIRTKGFHLATPDAQGNEQLFVASRKEGVGGEPVYKRVAVVERFFDIIYGVHVELEGRGGRHAGQKRTYRAITESYAFLPREAVTKFLLGCDCQRRTGEEGGDRSGSGNQTSSDQTPSPGDQAVPSGGADHDDATPKGVSGGVGCLRRRRLAESGGDSALSSSTPDSSRSRISYSTISRSSDVSDLSPIDSEPAVFQRPYPRAVYTVHPTTLETVRLPLRPSEISVRYERNRPFIRAKGAAVLGTYLRTMRSLGYSDEESLRLDDQEIRSTPEPDPVDDHYQGRNGDLSPGEEGPGGWPYHGALGAKKPTPPISRDIPSPATLQETGSVHDETSSSGNKEDDDDDEEEMDDLKAVPHDSERLKAFNMFVRLFVDENLDRIVPISKQPKEKIQAIIDSCTRQFPEFAERARKRIRTYLKSCRRNKRTRDSSWPESNRPTPAHLTSVQAEQILAQACENESHNAKRMRLGLDPLSQPLPLLPGGETPPSRPSHESFSAASLASSAANSESKPQQHQPSHPLHLNNNKPESPNLAKAAEPPPATISSMSSSPLNGVAPSPLFRPNFGQAFSRAAGPQPPFPPAHLFPNPPFGAPAIMHNGPGPTDLSMKQTKPLLSHKLSTPEMAAVRQLITGYRESAAFLLRSAEELEQLLLQQP